MDTIKGVVEGVKNTSLADKPTGKAAKERKDKKEKKGVEAGEDSRPLEVCKTKCMTTPGELEVEANIQLCKLDPAPEYILHRIQIFDKLKAQYDAEVAQKPRDKINITLDNDRIEVGTAWETTPAFIARQISKSLSERVVIARVNGELWDLDRPLEGPCRLELLDFEHPEGMPLPSRPYQSPG